MNTENNLIKTLDSNFKDILKAVKTLVKSNNNEHNYHSNSKRVFNQTSLDNTTGSKVKIRRPK